MGNHAKTRAQLESELAEARAQILALQRNQDSCSTERHQTVIAAAMDGFWITDVEGRFLDVNDAYCKLVGYTRNELLAMSVGDVEASEAPEDIRRHIALVVDRGHDRFETRHRAKDGTLVDLDVSAQYTPRDGGRFVVFLRDITERHNFERRLRETDERFRAFFEHAPVGKCMTAPDGRLEQVNPALCRLLGYDADHLTSLSFVEITHPEDVATSQECVRSLLAGERDTCAMEKRYRTKAGKYVWTSVTTRLLRDEHGKPLHFLTHILDIDDKKRAEAELARHHQQLERLVEERTRSLRDSEQRYRYLTELTTDYVFQLSAHPDGAMALEWVVGSFESLTGYDWRSIRTPDRWSAVVHPDDLITLGTFFAAALTGTESACEVRIRGKGDEWLWFALQGRPWRDEESSAIVGVLGAGTNVTGKKRAEESLRKTAAQVKGINRVLLASLDCPSDEEVAQICLEVAEELTGCGFGWIGEVNAEGLLDTIAMTNPGWSACRLTDRKHPELVRRMPIRGIWSTVIKTGASSIINDPESHPDRVGVPVGHPPITAFMGIPLIRGDALTGMISLANKRGGFVHEDQLAIESLSVAFVEALTRRRADDEIRRFARELEVSNQELESFAYAVSHDLRAPLRAIEGFSQALLEDYGDKLDDEGQDSLHRVSDQAQRMARLIDDLLKLSRVTRAELRKEPVDLSALALEVAHMLTSQETDRRIDIAVQPGLVAHGDIQLLRQMLTNLLDNALKFTRDNPHPRIEFGSRAAAKGDRHTLYFLKDNGVGFDMTYAKKLFTPFQRLHSSKGFEGTGIGLSTVHRVVKRHGGEIRVESTVGQGTTFYFTLTSTEEAAFV